MEINNCTKCGKKFDEIRIDVSLLIRTERAKENGIWERLPNLENSSKEILCQDCFDEFTHAFSSLNKKYGE